MNHLLFCGRRRNGRSAVIRKLLDGIQVPVWGYETVTLGTRPDGYHEIYLFPWGTEDPEPLEDHHIADCNSRDRVIHTEVFDTLGTACLKPQPGILVMDEIGFMESDAARFCDAVLAHLDSDRPILAAVRTGLETPFLRRVLEHPKACCFDMQSEDFDHIYEACRPAVLAWAEELASTGEKPGQPLRKEALP